jgi:hypothetical protein
MNYRLSKLARTMIIINVLFTLLIGSIHVYHAYQFSLTDDKISAVIAAYDVDREKAIDMLVADGEELFLGGELATAVGIIVCLFSLALLAIYGRTSGFFWGFFAATTGVFTSFIGGFLLFYVILSGKSEITKHNHKGEKVFPQNDWQKFIEDQAETATSRKGSIEHS